MNTKLTGPATRTVAALVALLATALTLLVLTNPARADTVTVTNTADPGNGICSQTGCTLREAIRSAKSGDTVKFSPSVSGTIKLSRSDGDLVVSKSLNIEGPGRDKLTISGEGHGGVLYISFTNPQVVIRDLTLSGGKELVRTNSNYTSGGGIFKTSGSLTLVNSKVSRNKAETGAGIYNEGGTLKLVNSTVSSNIARELPQEGEVIVIDHHGVSSAHGGGIRNEGGTLLLENSLVFDNRAGGHGGGIYNENITLLDKGNSVFSNSSGRGRGRHLHSRRRTQARAKHRLRQQRQRRWRRHLLLLGSCECLRTRTRCEGPPSKTPQSPETPPAASVTLASGRAAAVFVTTAALR